MSKVEEEGAVEEVEEEGAGLEQWCEANASLLQSRQTCCFPAPLLTTPSANHAPDSLKVCWL